VAATKPCDGELILEEHICSPFENEFWAVQSLEQVRKEDNERWRMSTRQLYRQSGVRRQ
jgi:hypothetical protein